MFMYQPNIKREPFEQRSQPKCERDKSAASGVFAKQIKKRTNQIEAKCDRIF